MSNVLKTNADSYSLDLTGRTVRPMTATAVAGNYTNLELVAQDGAGAYGEVRVALKIDTPEMASALIRALAEMAAVDIDVVREAAIKASQETEWQSYLWLALDPSKADLTIHGYCSHCLRPAMASFTDDSQGEGRLAAWVHQGASCWGPAEWRSETGDKVILASSGANGTFKLGRPCLKGHGNVDEEYVCGLTAQHHGVCMLQDRRGRKVVEATGTHFVSAQGPLMHTDRGQLSGESG